MKRRISTVHYGGIWIAAGLVTGLVIPCAVHLTGHAFPVCLSAAGGVILAAFLIVFLIEMRRASGKISLYKKHPADTVPFDPETQEAVIRSSVCTGEKVAGFRDRNTGHFTEVMLIRSPEEEKRFMAMYRLDHIRTEY